MHSPLAKGVPAPRCRGMYSRATGSVLPGCVQWKWNNLTQTCAMKNYETPAGGAHAGMWACPIPS
eukprot:6869401-Prymnesium_polylepis.1